DAGTSTAHGSNERGIVELGGQRIGGDMRDLGGYAVRADDRGHGQPSERALIDESQFGSSVGKREPHPEVSFQWGVRRLDEQLPAHPEVTDQRGAGLERQPEV